MKRKLIFTALFFLITLYTPLSLLSQDFEMDGTVLVRYNGNAAKITIPSSVTSIRGGAFYGCSSLTSITISTSVTTIGSGAFSECSSLTSITVAAQNSAYSSVDGILFNKNRTVLIAYPAGIQGRTYTIPTGVTSIGVGAFYGCSNLTSITIPPSVTTIVNEAFYGCSSLTSITIPPSVTSIGDYAFSRCSSLTSITVDIQNGGYSSVEGILFNKNRTVLVAYPAGKQVRTYTIPSSVTSIRGTAFYGCSSLTSITIPYSVTFIGGFAFYNCTSLISVTIPSSVTSIGDFAFSECTSLLSVMIPSSVTYLGFFAFAGCSSLTSITIPPSVTSIDDFAFTGCTSLGTVVVSRRTIIGANAFPSTARITYSD